MLKGEKMSDSQRFAVLGSGNGARAFCAQIAAKNYPVVMYEPLEATPDYLKLKAEKSLFLEGDIQAGGALSGVTMDIQTAVSGADVIFVVVPSFAHRPIFEKMIPHLRDGQHIIIVPGNYGAYLLKKLLASGNPCQVAISETASLPYACRIRSFNTVRIHKKKFKMKLASSPSAANTFAVDLMNDIFAGYIQYFAGANLLETDLDNLNQTLHPLPVLLNYGEIEKRPDTFRHYVDGVTPLIAEQMMAMDEERLALGKALNLNLMAVMDQLKMYYGHNDTTTYYDYVNSPESPYTDIVGHNVRSRYLTEDVPCLHVPSLELAEMVDVKMPVTRVCVRLASILHATDYAQTGITLEKIGLAGKSVAELVQIAS
jgi:opine dehydrogenase